MSSSMVRSGLSYQKSLITKETSIRLKIDSNPYWLNSLKLSFNHLQKPSLLTIFTKNFWKIPTRRNNRTNRGQSSNRKISLLFHTIRNKMTISKNSPLSKITPDKPSISMNSLSMQKAKDQRIFWAIYHSIVYPSKLRIEQARYPEALKIRYLSFPNWAINCQIKKRPAKKKKARVSMKKE